MYPVSDKYSALIAAPVRYTGISGTVTLKSGEVLALSDKNIKQGTLSITDKLNRQGDFRPGGVYSSELSASLKGFGGTASDLDGGQVELEFRIFEDNSFAAFEAVPLGRFYVDGSTIERSFDTVSFKANDCLMLFDRAITGDRSGSLYELVSIACANCGVPLAMLQGEFEAFPNGTLTASVNSARIQTERDLLMYAALCTGTFLSADRDTGGVKFVPLSCTKDDFGMIIPVREINTRTSTKFSDDATRVTKLFTRRNGEKVLSQHELFITGNAKPTTLELLENPLFSALSETELGAALDEILYKVGRCLNRAFRTTFNGDPALEIGDYVRLRGGAIDTERGYATGMITSSTWRYRGEHRIQCSLPPVVRGSSASAVSLLSDDETSEETEQYTQPKSQTEKRMDELKAKINSTGGLPEPITMSVTDDSGYGDSVRGFTIQDPSGAHKVSVVKNAISIGVGNNSIQLSENGLVANIVPSFTPQGVFAVLTLKPDGTFQVIMQDGSVQTSIDMERTGFSIKLMKSDGSGENRLDFNGEGLFINHKRVLTEG